MLELITAVAVVSIVAWLLGFASGWFTFKLLQKSDTRILQTELDAWTETLIEQHGIRVQDHLEFFKDNILNDFEEAQRAHDDNQLTGYYHDSDDDNDVDSEEDDDTNNGGNMLN